MTILHRTAYGVFAWDEAKAASNLKKHGISFETAAATFSDKQGVLKADIDHSDDEERLHWIGRVYDAVIILTVFTENGHTRIISARVADKKEEGLYYANF